MKNNFYTFNSLFFLMFIASASLADTTSTGAVINAEIAVSTETAPPVETSLPSESAVSTEVTVPGETTASEETAASEEIAAAQETVPQLDPQLYQQAVSQILPKDNRQVGKLEEGEAVFTKRTILKMLEQNDQPPLWDPISIQSLSDALDGLAADGLNPSEYRFEEIEPYLNDPTHTTKSPEEAARIDVLLSEAYLRALYNLEYGKVDPQRLDADHNFASSRDGADRSAQLLSWVRKGRIDEAFDWARPKSDSYKLLKVALARYQKIMADGGWTEIPSGKVIKLGKSDSRIPLVRSRLAITGDLASADGPDTIDVELEQAIIKFQNRNHLKTDGVIGRSTLAVMNVTVEQRVDQIRANIDRQRWYFPKDLDEYLVVDVAGFQIYWMKNQEVIWQEHVQVGKRFTSTPIFRDQIEHIDFNPTWSVPPGINRRTILPSLKIDPSYLDKKGYRLLDDTGRDVDPYSIDWEGVSEMPFTVRQPPGWGNALGKVKFMFPNRHSVFLHDTNHRELFARQVRTTSSGCIRLQNPFVFAERLLSRQEGWDRDRIDQIVRSSRTTRIDLEKPLPILIQYSTVSVTDDEVFFRSDIYRRDYKLLAALDRSFELHVPDLPKRTQLLIQGRVKSASASAAKLLAPEPEIIGEPYTGTYYRDEPDSGGNSMFEL